MPIDSKDKNQPWIENYPPLEAWLAAHHARCDWQAKLGAGNRASMIEQWRFPNGSTALITIRSHRDGWDLYVPAHKGNDIGETLRKATEALGLTPSENEHLKRTLALADAGHG